MPISGVTLDPIRAYGKEYIVLACKVTIGASGAVASVDGKGFGSGPLVGSVTQDSTGVYSFVMPGRGSVHDILLASCVVEHATDVLLPSVTAVDLSARKVVVTFWGALPTVPAATDPSENATLHLVFLVKNSDID